MRAWSVLRQLLAATLCAVLVAPAYPSESTLPRNSSTPSHTYDAETLSKTRVWGSNEKNLLHFKAVEQLSEKQRWGCANCSSRIVVGSSVVTYDYDAFGNLIHQTGTTPNNYLYSGEQFDPDLNLYYNRARYLNVSTGRFWSMDTDEGRDQAPLSLHKYLYANANPVNRRDRTGHDDIGELAVAGGISGVEDASAAEADSLAIRVLNTLTNRGATVKVLGTASSLVPAFKAVETAFEENEGIVVELQDELFAIRYVATEAQADGIWWGTQLFNTTQQAIDALALNPVWGNTAQEIVFGVIPKGAQLIVGYAASQGALSGGAFQILADSQTLISIALME